MSPSTLAQEQAGNYARGEHYPYLITGILNPLVSETETKLSDLVSELQRSQLCRHGAYVRHSPGLNCRFSFTIFNTCPAEYQAQDKDVITDEGISFIVPHYAQGASDDVLVMTGRSRKVNMSAVSAGVYQFGAKVVALDIFSASKMYERGPIACRVRIRE